VLVPTGVNDLIPAGRVLWTHAHPVQILCHEPKAKQPCGVAYSLDINTIVFVHSICQHQYVLLLDIPNLYSFIELSFLFVEVVIVI